MQVINEGHAFSFLCKPLEYDKLELQILELLNQLPDLSLIHILIDHWGEENRNGNKQYWFDIWGSISSETDFFHVWKGNSGIF